MSIAKVKTTYTGYQLRPWVPCCILLPFLGLLAYFLWPRPAAMPAKSPMPDCTTDYDNWQVMWSADRAAWCCSNQGRGCPPHREHRHVIYVNVPAPAPVVHYHHSHFKYDCHSGYSNWYFGWSAHKKGWCCQNANMGCPGTWHGSYHLSAHMMHGVGHAHGRIYDCNAGFSNWMQGWSDSKKDWCCQHNARGCQKFHCTGASAMWGTEKRDWCCNNFQKACPRTRVGQGFQSEPPTCI